MKIRYVLLFFFSVLAVACSYDLGGGDSGSGNNGSGNNNSTETTDPTVFTAMTSSGNTTYYVSFSSGNDSNDGKSEDKPFKNFRFECSIFLFMALSLAKFGMSSCMLFSFCHINI